MIFLAITSQCVKEIRKIHTLETISDRIQIEYLLKINWFVMKISLKSELMVLMYTFVALRLVSVSWRLYKRPFSPAVGILCITGCDLLKDKKNAVGSCFSKSAGRSYIYQWKEAHWIKNGESLKNVLVFETYLLFFLTGETSKLFE